MTSNDKLYFYSGSKDLPPGAGKNEHVDDPGLYADLANIKDWRKILSNFHVCPFQVKIARKILTFNTIEHAFQASKIALVDFDKAYTFSIESASVLGLGDGLAARKARKLVVLNDVALKVWDEISQHVMAELAALKYQECPEARRVLKATQNAQLWHIVMRSKNHTRFEHLEKLRHGLS